MAAADRVEFSDVTSSRTGSM